MLPRLDSTQVLLSWGADNGAECDPKVEVYQDSTTGLSFKALEEIPPDSNIVKCSYDVSLSYLNAIKASGFSRRSEAFPSTFLESLGKDDPNVIGYFFLMQQYLLGKESFWWPYIQALPQPDNPEHLSIPIWWPDKDLRFLDGTNAGPPIQKRKDMWMKQWKEAIDLLRDSDMAWESYTFELFVWSGTIFGSRSFRPSLTIANGMFEDDSQIQKHISKDRFSVLYPIVDIGNHNGYNNVVWHPKKDTGLGFYNKELISQGSQIYNFYGSKSNSELLVAYGFILPGSDGDSVNLKLKPSPNASALRRRQACHVIPSNPEEEFMYTVRKQDNHSGVMEFEYFPHGLVDLILAMLANEREVRSFWANSKSLDYCAGLDTKLYSSALYKSSFQLLQILHQKLNQEITRLVQTDPGSPQTPNQALAHQYRHRQLTVLHSAMAPVTNRLSTLLSKSSLCEHSQHKRPASESEDMEVLSLECAFDWLRIHHLDIFNQVVALIAEDQDEPLPLNWAVLVEDWDRTYWVVWVYIMLWIHGSGGSSERLISWIADMQEQYATVLDSNKEPTLAANYDTSEKETITMMLDAIAAFPRFASPRPDLALSQATKYRNFASFLVERETVPAEWTMDGGQALPQLVICIRAPFA